MARAIGSMVEDMLCSHQVPNSIRDISSQILRQQLLENIFCVRPVRAAANQTALGEMDKWSVSISVSFVHSYKERKSEGLKFLNVDKCSCVGEVSQLGLAQEAN